ncbi:MAG: N-acetyl-alpha-D-glucosaminyl L-malate synthase BshA [Chlamydiota bacterium]
MKIGIVCYPTVGGSGVVATELGHQLANRGHEVHFITYALPFRLRLEEENIYFHEVEINQYDLFQYPDYALTLAVKIASVAECHQLDILHVHYAIPHATSAFLAKQILENHRDKPSVVTTLHGTDITLVGIDRAYYQVVKFSIEKSDAVTAVSDNLRYQTQEAFNIANPIETIYNFFIPKNEYLNNRTLRHEFVTEEEKLIVHASNYRPVKRVIDVIHIFERVKERIPSKLLLLGTGPDINAVRRYIQKQELEKSVHFLGVSREIDPYISCSDLFLLPSEQESFGLVALESMSYGVPVVASKVGGVPEVVIDGECGYLETCGDINALSDKTLKILTNDQLHHEMSLKAMERAKMFFSADQIVPQYEELYERLYTLTN